MIDTPEVTQSVAQNAAVLHVTVPRSEIRTVMGPGYREVMDAIRSQGMTPAGPWFTHHLRTDPDVFDFEIGIPVARPIAPAGRVQPGQLPPARVARTVHRGSYEGLGRSWGEFMAWIEKAGHTPGPDFWEAYTVGPEVDPDPSAWRTELNRPLR
ncbi:MAG TPA: GyrI-like domain-containing protein [Gemmatimonadales bacterium]|jgi:effector-binding domain-containing protein